MTHKLAIGNVVVFPVRLKVQDGPVKKDFHFMFEGSRVSEEEIRATYETDGDMKLSAFHAERCREGITGWRDQRLVLDEDDKPAPFSPEGLALVLSIPGAATLIYNAWIEAVVASTGLQGRAKN